ncbi:acetoacetate--CoA ligase [Actinomadura welshii]|uniref:acetoacetate--CoA ligase n=1 Tax=Actinomadura welshii TaxID=3103817 RepID=UPI0003AD1092|nr:acetoacetate--CoA ligase [Actinomadura madurae]
MSTTSIGTSAEPRVLWTPPQERVAKSRMVDFAAWWSERLGRPLETYQELWNASVADIGRFWADLALYFDVTTSLAPGAALVSGQMPGARWFPYAELNFAELALRGFEDRDIAVVTLVEGGEPVEVTAGELRRQAGALARTLVDLGVRPGDRVAAYLPNTLPALVGLLASASIGAVWAVCAPDFGPESVLDRLGQLEPAVLIAADGYVYGGRVHDRTDEALAVHGGLPARTQLIWVDAHRPGSVPDDAVRWWEAVAKEPLSPRPLPFDHPLWVLFSSGTTGIPKGIVHGHGGVALEQLKTAALHMDLGKGDRFFWYTSTAWMVWNVVASSLLSGATAVLYDGSPHHPELDAQWALAEKLSLTYLGTGAGYLTACTQKDLRPGSKFDLSRLRSVGSTGSPLPADAARWVYRSVSSDVYLSSTTGGTDVATGFIGGAPLLPVYAGALSGPMLGAAIDCWDAQGRPLIGAEGELVITEPMPSMPLYFWNDPDGQRYRAAYFDQFPNVWRHGDRVLLTSERAAIVSGRSDATLNRGGVRTGTAEIYAAIGHIAAIRESLVLGVEEGDGDYWMPLFVVLEEGRQLDDGLRAEVSAAVAEKVSRRHVPDDIIVVRALPHTRTGKKIEVPLKRMFQGVAMEDAVNIGSIDDATALREFAEMAKRRLTRRSVK